MSIDVRNLSFAYKKDSCETPVLDDITLTINKGEFVGIVGEVGCGKSTLVKHFNGLLKPDSGTVEVDDMSATDRKVKGRIGMLFQHPSKQLFCKTVYDDIAFGPSNFSVSGNKLEGCVHNACKQVGLDLQLLSSSPFDLSGGQMRLVALAGILSYSPSYLILDEPLSGLDPMSKRGFLSTLEGIRANGTGVVVISHDLDNILHYVDRVILLNAGKIAFEGTPAQYLASGITPVPEITQLIRLLRSRGLDVSDSVYSVDDAFDQIIKALKSRKRHGDA
ncbi:MAG: ATP-binding cassette domain-containing protein [Methanosarcinaceae archaeon]|nr:ATP-binding cassette domain-containing protein [Methanosarcinaceae archaeon]